jgi:hypothetical protein
VKEPLLIFVLTVPERWKKEATTLHSFKRTQKSNKTLLCRYPLRWPLFWNLHESTLIITFTPPQKINVNIQKSERYGLAAKS